MIIPKVQAMITAASGRAFDLEGALLKEIKRLQDVLPKDAQIYAGIHFGDELLAPTPYAKLFAQSPPAFDGFIGASHASGFEPLMTAFATLGMRLHSLIDPSRSAMIAGKEHTILPGREDFLYTLVFRHPAASSRAEAQAYWRHEHAKFALDPNADPDQMMRGYRQFHMEEPASRRAALHAELPCDDITGVVEAYCRSGAEMAERLMFPEIENLVIPDERRFIDHSRSRGAFYRMIGNT